MTQLVPEMSRTQIATSFRTSAEDLAGDLRDACLPLLPAHQARLLSSDELHVTSGLEQHSPLAAAVMALSPAVAAVGVSVAGLGVMDSRTANQTVGVAESVIDAAVDALTMLDDPAARDDPAGAAPAIELAHRVAHATHLASALARDGQTSVLAAASHPPRPPALWPRLLDSLNHRIRLSQRGQGAAAVPWQNRLHAAAACRDAATGSMRAHARLVARTASSTERLIRCLTFASLYCGFATLEAAPAPAGLARLAERALAPGALLRSRLGRAAHGGPAEPEHASALP